MCLLMFNINGLITHHEDLSLRFLEKPGDQLDQYPFINNELTFTL